MDKLGRWPNEPIYTADLSGKTAVVIGANTGIGIEVAKHFAKMNAERVIITCRDDKKGAVAVDTITKETGSSKVESWALELGNFASVTAFIDRFEKDGGRLDYLVVNAAVALNEFSRTEDGWETSMQVNHLSNTLIALLLLPLLKKTADKYPGSHPRLVIVASEVHAFTTFSTKRIPSGKVLATLNDEDWSVKQEEIKHRYPDTKLMNILFTRALAARLPADFPVIVTAVCPGFCTSELVRHLKDRSMLEPLLPHARTPEEGSRQLIFASIAGEKEGTVDDFRGVFVHNRKISAPSEWVQSEEAAKVQDLFWDETIEEISKISPKVPKVLGEYLAK